MSLIPKKGTVYVVDDDEAVRDAPQRRSRLECGSAADDHHLGVQLEAVGSARYVSGLNQGAVGDVHAPVYPPTPSRSQRAVEVHGSSL